MSETEKDFQAQVVQLAHLYQWRVMHVRKSIGKRGGQAGWQTTTSIKGWPDLFLYHPVWNVSIAAELKSNKGKVSEDQTIVLEELRNSGIPAFVWRPQNWDGLQRVLSDQDVARGVYLLCQRHGQG